MESPAASAAANAGGPRVYIPITHPDSPVPAYAVLQFVGLMSSSSPSNMTLLPHGSSPSTTTTITQNSALPNNFKQLVPCSSPVGSSSSAASSSYGSDRDCKETKLTSVKRSSMKKKSSRSPTAAQRVSGKNLPTSTAAISITHTQKDTIIHTDSSNFREVVHRLTGASSGDIKDLMPVSMSATTSSRRNGAEKDVVIPASPPAPATITLNNNVKQESLSPCMKRPIGNTTKLLQRRKPSKVLDRLMYPSFGDLPPLVPSPVTPLASDFEKINLPGMAVQESCPHQVAGVLGSSGSRWLTSNSNLSHDEEEAIVRKGFFFQSNTPTPRQTNPTLLPLFPESPSGPQ